MHLLQPVAYPLSPGHAWLCRVLLDALCFWEPALVLKKLRVCPAPRMAGKTSSKTHERNWSASFILEEKMTREGNSLRATQLQVPAGTVQAQIACCSAEQMYSTFPSWYDTGLVPEFNTILSGTLYACFTCSYSALFGFSYPKISQTSLLLNHSFLSLSTTISTSFSSNFHTFWVSSFFATTSSWDFHFSFNRGNSEVTHFLSCLAAGRRLLKIRL